MEATDGKTGLATFLTHQEEIDLVLTDMIMPKHPGPEMVEAILARSPHQAVAFVSGTIEFHPLMEHLRHVPTLLKPFRTTQLLTFVRECLKLRSTGTTR